MNTRPPEAIVECKVCGSRNRVSPRNIGRSHVCGKFHTPLQDLSTVSRKCAICGLECGNRDQLLSNGSLYHQSCHLKIIQEIERIEQQSSAHQAEILRLSRVMQTEQSLSSRIGRFVSGRVSKIPQWRNQIQALEREVQALKNERLQRSEVLRGLYDYWLTYPPDWEERREEVLRNAQTCENCGSGHGPLHVHHEVSISKGGSHSVYNLCVLCEKCHERRHGGRAFKYGEDAQPGPFAKKLNTLRDAIGGGKLIHFRYRKYDGAESVRSVRPVNFQRFQGSLCIVGYCYLRKAQRSFAIRRMNELKVIETPGTCYDKG